MPSAHALLSPSAAKRWMNCTAAPLLEQQIEDKGSDYAKEGTLAHAYCAKALKEYLQLADNINISTASEDKEIAELHDDYYSAEMDEHVESYKTIVLSKYNAALSTTSDARLLVEQRITFDDYLPETFGTADAVIIADGLMEVIDFKYGKGVKVDAYQNPQMMIYALGSLIRYGYAYDIQTIRMSIVQPRLDSYSEYTMEVADLTEWAENKLKPAAIEAASGNGKQCAGDWCQFCKVKPVCKHLAEKCMKDSADHYDHRLLTPGEIALKVLPVLPLIKAWVKTMEDYTKEQALAGVSYPGFKLVEGRSVRKITDQGGAIKALTEAGIPLENVLKPAELKTITELEKAVGKKAFAEICKDYIVKPAGAPTLVPNSDKRPAMGTASEFDDFITN